MWICAGVSYAWLCNILVYYLFIVRVLDSLDLVWEADLRYIHIDEIYETYTHRIDFIELYIHTAQHTCTYVEVVLCIYVCTWCYISINIISKCLSMCHICIHSPVHSLLSLTLCVWECECVFVVAVLYVSAIVCLIAHKPNWEWVWSASAKKDERGWLKQVNILVWWALNIRLHRLTIPFQCD